MKRSRAFALIVIASFLFGTSGIFVRLLNPYGFTSMQMTAIRGLVSAIALGIYILLNRKKKLHFQLKHLPWYLCSGLCMFITAFLYYASMEHTTIATSVVLMYSSPIYIVIFSALFLKEKMSAYKIVSLILMLVGMALVSGIVGGIDFNPTGVILGIAAGVTYAVYNIVVKMCMEKGGDPTSSVLICYIVTGLCAGFFGDMPAMVGLTTQNPLLLWTLIVLLGLCTSTLPHLMYATALRAVPAGTASTLSLLEPLAAIVYALVLFNEPLTLPLIIGGVLILGGVFLIGKIKE